MCGSRTFEHADVVDGCLFGQTALIGDDPEFVVIEGGARGADALAATWAKAFRRTHEQFPADWDTHGKAAGAIRNQQMLKQGQPDVVWAFVDKPLEQSRGTHHMVRIAREAGVPVRVVEVM